MGKENIMENMEIKIEPERVLFQKNLIVIEESKTKRRRILYKDIVFAYIRTLDDVTGEYQTLEITDITGRTDGELVLYDREHRKWIIRADRTGQKAGALFEGLCTHAPYILAGGQDWFDCSKEEDFEMVREMVELMRECSRQ